MPRTQLSPQFSRPWIHPQRPHFQLNLEIKILSGFYNRHCSQPKLKRNLKHMEFPQKKLYHKKCKYVHFKPLMWSDCQCTVQLSYCSSRLSIFIAFYNFLDMINSLEPILDLNQFLDQSIHNNSKWLKILPSGWLSTTLVFSVSLILYLIIYMNRGLGKLTKKNYIYTDDICCNSYNFLYVVLYYVPKFYILLYWISILLFEDFKKRLFYIKIMQLQLY